MHLLSIDPDSVRLLKMERRSYGKKPRMAKK
jgi:hypothetical protein